MQTIILKLYSSETTKVLPLSIASYYFKTFDGSSDWTNRAQYTHKPTLLIRLFYLELH